jgi:hypothetical protein
MSKKPPVFIEKAAILRRALAKADQDSVSREQLKSFRAMPSNHGKEQGPFGQPSGLPTKGNLDAWSGRAEYHGAHAQRGPVAPRPQVESALTVLLRQQQAAEAAQVEAQKAIEEYRRAEAAHLSQQRAQLPLEDRLSLMPNLSNPKRDFLRQHPSFIDNPDIEAAHWQALDAGHADDSPEYFAHVAKQLDRLAPKPTAPESGTPRPPQPRGPVVSAPVSRDSISISTGRPVDTKITLTPAQREAAKFSMPGVAPEIAEREYAKNLIRLEQARRAGLLQNGEGR